MNVSHIFVAKFLFQLSLFVKWHVGWLLGTKEAIQLKVLLSETERNNKSLIANQL